MEVTGGKTEALQVTLSGLRSIKLKLKSKKESKKPNYLKTRRHCYTSYDPKRR